MSSLHPQTHPKIHPTAVIDPAAELDSSVSVGAFSVIEGPVCIDADTVIESHVVIKGRTRIGKNNHVFQFSSLGEVPQDKKYQGEDTALEIGDNNTIREGCTFHKGTVQDQGITRIGNHNWLMAYVHIAHDCVVGNHTIFANNSSLAGHVHIGDYAVLGGFTLVHQFCKIGAYTITAANAVIFMDIPPYVMAVGYSATPTGLNLEGLRRHGFSAEQRQNIKQAYQILYQQGLSLKVACEQLQDLQQRAPEVALFLSFITQSQRGIARPAHK